MAEFLAIFPLCAAITKETFSVSGLLDLPVTQMNTFPPAYSPFWIFILASDPQLATVAWEQHFHSTVTDSRLTFRTKAASGVERMKHIWDYLPLSKSRTAENAHTQNGWEKTLQTSNMKRKRAQEGILKHIKLHMVSWNPSTQEIESRGLEVKGQPLTLHREKVSSRPAWSYIRPC